MTMKLTMSSLKTKEMAGDDDNDEYHYCCCFVRNHA